MPDKEAKPRIEFWQGTLKEYTPEQLRLAADVTLIMQKATGNNVLALIEPPRGMG